MLEEAYWNSVFDITRIVDWLNVKAVTAPIVEIGCGYGMFTVPVAKEAIDNVYSFDIEPKMIETAESNVQQADLHNVRFFLRDVVEQGTGLEPDGVGMVLVFQR